MSTNTLTSPTPSLLNQEVTLRGYLYLSPENEWILADTPNLKSCCLCVNAHVTLLGDFSLAPLNTPLTVKGTLLAKTNSAPLSYQLKNPSLEVVQTSREGFPYYTGGAILLLLLLPIAFRRLKRLLLP